MKFVRLSGTLIFLFTFSIAINMYRFNYGINDGFWRTLMAPFTGTIWAPSFSESNFDQIKISMNSVQVLSLLDEPLRKDCDIKECFWIYTSQDTSTADFDQRWVIFDNADKVIEIRKSFFID